MIPITSESMRRAIARASVLRPHVRMTGERTYAMSGSNGASYTVRFAVANGLKLASCDCKAREAGMICYHIAGAAAVNIGIHAMRRLAARSEPHRKQLEEVMRRTDGRVFAGPIEV